MEYFLLFSQTRTV